MAARLHIWTEYRQAVADVATGRTIAAALRGYGFTAAEARDIARQLADKGEARCRIFTIREA